MRPRVLTMDYINVPIALLQEVKEDPLQWSLVALSVAMKCLSPSSTYIFTSEKTFRRDFHLGYTKARNLLDAIREGHSLFQMTTCPNGRQIIVARSLKKMYATQVTLKGGRKSLEMVAGKVKRCTREDLHVTEIEKEMRQLLLLTNISAKTRADELQSKGLPLTGSASHAAKTILSVNYLAKATGRSPRTVSRMTKAARQQRVINVIQYPLVRCCNDILHTLPSDSVGKIIRIGFFGFTRRCNDYQLLSWDWRHRFQHILYGHRRRLTHNLVLPQDTVMSQTDLHALYD
ncbi:MAG: hypothetical protein IKX59_00785 [Bacteroidales bacterium]|nr:hypothetical protein [Bacteroidales bacterium]